MSPEAVPYLMPFLQAAALLFGLSVGSFLNVVIWRVPRGESIVNPPSHCTACGTDIRWFHNLPILSWLLLKGQCAHCGASIDFRYLVVELIGGALALACLAQFGPTAFAFRAFAFAAMLVALTYIDLEHWLLPHALTWPGIALGLATAGVPDGPGWVPSLLGAAIGFAAFWLLRVVGEWVFKKEALGGGDVFLMAMLGAFLGWRALLPVVFLASVQGSIVGLVLLFARRREASTEAGAAPEKVAEPEAAEAVAEPDSADDVSEPAEPLEAATEGEEEDAWVPPANAVPFGPFLALAGLEMLFAGELIMGWFLRFIGMG